MARTPTPHNEAIAGQIAPFVLIGIRVLKFFLALV